MIKVTYVYSFINLSGKPKRFIEASNDCKLISYGVTTDTVTLSVLFENTKVFNTLNKAIYDKFKLVPQSINFI